MKFDKEKYLEKDKTTEDIIIESNLEGEEVKQKVLHIKVSDTETEEILNEFDTSCCLLFAYDKKEGGIHALTFCADKLGSFIGVLSAAEKYIETAKEPTRSLILR